MDVKTIADLAHDELVDLCVSVGYFSEDADINNRFFAAVHLIVWRKLDEVAREQNKEDVQKLRQLLACERSRWMQRLQKVSLS